MKTSFYSKQQLNNLRIASVGKNVHISNKCSIYNPEKIKIGNNVRIDDFCLLSGNITIGNNVHISAYTALYGANAGIFIDDYVALSSRVTVYAINDDYSGNSLTNPTVDNKFKNVTELPVYIKKHVIVGSTSVILPGVTINEGAAFGSFSFINHDCEPWSINAGIPFKKTKTRSKNLLTYLSTYDKK